MKQPFLVLCVLASVLLTMGTPHLSESQQIPATVHVSTYLVQVNVIVLDHHGRPVSGLTRNDFKVFDNGKPQKIAIFRVESNQPPASPPKLPSNAFSNYAERAGSAPPSVTVILLDALNTPMAAQIYARQQVVKFLEQLQPNDHVALYALTNRLLVLHDFTSDSAALLQALHHYHEQYVSQAHGGEPSGGFPNPLAQFVGGAENLEKAYQAGQQVRITTNALVAIANHLAGLPGRKNLVWVSAGFPLWNGLNQMLKRNTSTKPQDFQNLQDFNSPVAHAARALNNVNLAIDPVDARGLMADPNISAMHHSVGMGISTGFEDSFATMDKLARQTGGRAFYNTNGIRQSIRRVVDDSKVNYVLGYYPQGVNWNGEFRKVKVRVDRHGFRLQYRHGYSALPEEKVPEGKTPRSLDAVVNSPLDATGIGLAVQMFPEKGASTAGGPAYQIRLQIDPKDITFQPQGSLRVANLTLVTDEFGPQGQNLKGGVQKATIRLQPDLYQKVLAEGEVGFGERLLLPLLYNAERLRVVIRDNPTGRMGSVNVPLDHGFLPAKPFFTKRTPNG